MAKHKLEPLEGPEVQLIGISSHVNDYRLCWALNRQLGLTLTRRPRDIEEPGPEGIASFSAFDHLDETAQPAYTLVNNHCGDGVLLREQKQADYFLVVDPTAHLTDADLLEQVRATEFVLTAFTLDMRRLREAHKLLQ
ncbi:MAG TPA: IPExxxVDY family protein [Flavobacteriales bacterium]|nr:IPExxxVDY family protein [Flavobacteriales bacterium]